MKLTIQQQTWIRDYEGYRRAGGYYNSADSVWLDFEDIPTPQWYKDYLVSLEDTVEDSNVEDSTVEDPFSEPVDIKKELDIAIRNAARGLGRKGGLETAKRGSQYYSDIAKKRWLNR